MPLKSLLPPIKYVLIAIWFVFTLALSCWWVIFSLGQLDRLALLDHRQAANLVRYQRMLLWEGGTLLLCLIGGAIALTRLVFREIRNTRRLNDFFLALTHELKTPLAAISLQGQIIAEKVKDPGLVEASQALVTNTGRLNLQLENALFIANESRFRVLKEKVALSDVIRNLEQSFPELQIKKPGDATLEVDRRATELILGNLAHNALIHAGAKNLDVEARQASDRDIALRITDDGQGFRGDPKKLASLFFRHTTSSGSGVGLYSVKRLARMMGGLASFAVDNGNKFVAEIKLPGRLIA